MTTKPHGPLINVEVWFTTSPEEILRGSHRPQKPMVVVTRKDGEIVRRRVRARPA